MENRPHTPCRAEEILAFTSSYPSGNRPLTKTVNPAYFPVLLTLPGRDDLPQRSHVPVGVSSHLLSGAYPHSQLSE